MYATVISESNTHVCYCHAEYEEEYVRRKPRVKKFVVHHGESGEGDAEQSTKISEIYPHGAQRYLSKGVGEGEEEGYGVSVGGTQVGDGAERRGKDE
jgi:hypothetical protein